MLVELHAGIGVFDRDHRPKTVGRLYDPGTDVEPLHHELLRASARRITDRSRTAPSPPQLQEYPTFTVCRQHLGV